MPRFQCPKAETRKIKHLQPLILPHNRTPLETHTHTKDLQTKYSKGRIQIAQILDTRQIVLWGSVRFDLLSLA
jgi:hypothetical protein